MRTAVVLFNLGGPDSPEAVEPFLFNLFYDPAIIPLPKPLRWLVAKLISWRRRQTAQKIYAHMGGKSPILENTQAQAQALEEVLDPDHKVFITMRYWNPRAQAVVSQVRSYNPDRVVLLPLYPQYSTTTTESSFMEWERECRIQGYTPETHRILEYPSADFFVGALVERTREKIKDMQTLTPECPRILFSAHGLPKGVIDGGDPYQSQVEQTVHALRIALRDEIFEPVTCYQSRVGPKEWIGPSTEEEILRAGHDQKPLIVVPVAFVSEHSETLVELDIEYAELAHQKGVPHYLRVPTVAVDPIFIHGLAALVKGKVFEGNGAAGENRTLDLTLTKGVLYH